MDLPQKIEAILFWKAEPVAFKKIASILAADLDAVRSAVNTLEENLKGRGITVVQTDTDVMLGTAKELAPLLDQMRKDELTHDLGKAGLETLSIILYQGPISRTNIDYIRGVNSQFILRSLLVRGLVERVDNPEDSRSFLYKPTIELLAHLGINKISDLPEYEQVRSEIESFKSTKQN